MSRTPSLLGYACLEGNAAYIWHEQQDVLGIVDHKTLQGVVNYRIVCLREEGHVSFPLQCLALDCTAVQ